MKLENPSKITNPQLKYIETLAKNLNYTRIELYTQIQEITQRNVKFLYELTKKEASDVISKFKKDWEERKEYEQVLEEEQEY